ncbi:TonB-dependent receptor [Phocaeicola vulgatus]|uniref:SusC/RagA family TonB-linked outer membrane protein n=1 Tax=Phocaeicola vulgatus TaxID=821 RepID=UPI001F1A7514|nr:TonB-dependent receptor [Phocaeicola vulgatus]MCE9351389.1 TonB-dependent receptor [Phocaeicola vulgatus]
MKNKKDELSENRMCLMSFLWLLMFTCSSTLGMMAQNSVNGKVTDSTGEPIIGASVLEKGTTNGTITDFNGNFSLMVSSRAVLQITYIGYMPVEVIVSDKSTVNVTMKEDTETLDEVVVVGYGTQKKSDLTGAVTSIKADGLKGLISGNASEALQGKSGVYVTSMGSPGSSPIVKIRGIGTNGDSNPLYVVDGMMVDDIQYLNSSDIASMDVLKDASATAIYGSRGANGVIMITTKTGKKGRPVVSYSGSEGFQFLTRQYDSCNGSEYARMMNIIAGNMGTENPYSNPLQYGKGTDWTDEITRNGWTRNHQLTVNGGSDAVAYNMSVGYFSQEGIFKNTDYDRLSVRINNNYKLNKKITIGHNLALSVSNSPFELSYRTMRSVLGASPLLAPKDENGNWSSMQDADYINPAAELALNKDYNSNNIRFVGNFWGEWEILPGVRFRTSFGEDWSHTYWDQFKPAYNINSSHQSNPTNTYEENYSTMSTWLWENTLTFDKTFDDIHRLNFLAGYTAEKTHYRGLGAQGKNYVVDDIDYATISSATLADRTVVAVVPYTTARASYMFRLNYVLKDRYLLTATVRADGSSKFGINNRWGYFPSAAIGWRVSEETFMKENISWISNLKLRASWGQTGNDKITNNVSYRLVSQSDEYHAIFNGIFTPGAGIMSSSNPDIKWERTEQLDLGFDFAVLNNRLSLEFDYFTRETKDLLMILPIPGGSAGYSATYSNAGSVRNKGVEFTMRWQDDTHPFKYGITLNGSSFKNEVTDWGGQQTTNGIWSTYSQQRIEKGQPLNYFYGYNVVGIYRTQADLDKWNKYAINKGQSVYHAEAKLGDPVFEDVNGDGKITGDDQTNIGCPYPKFTGSLGFNAEYKGIDLNIDFATSIGAKVLNSMYTVVTSPTTNMHKDWLNSWTSENINAELPRVNNSSITSGTCNSLGVMRGDYFKIRNIELGYTLPEEWLGKYGISKLRVFVNAANLLYLTPYKGFSPEISFWGVIGVDYNSYPNASSLNFGLNLTF